MFIKYPEGSKWDIRHIKRQMLLSWYYKRNIRMFLKIKRKLVSFALIKGMVGTDDGN